MNTETGYANQMLWLHGTVFKEPRWFLSDDGEIVGHWILDERGRSTHELVRYPSTPIGYCYLCYSVMQMGQINRYRDHNLTRSLVLSRREESFSYLVSTAVWNQTPSHRHHALPADFFGNSGLCGECRKELREAANRQKECEKLLRKLNRKIHHARKSHRNKNNTQRHLGPAADAAHQP